MLLLQLIVPNIAERTVTIKGRKFEQYNLRDDVRKSHYSRMQIDLKNAESYCQQYR